MAKLYVLAGNAGEVVAWARSTNIPLSSLQYVTNEYKIRGLRDIEYMILPGFWERQDSPELFMAIQLVASGMALRSATFTESLENALLAAEAKIKALQAENIVLKSQQSTINFTRSTPKKEFKKINIPHDPGSSV